MTYYFFDIALALGDPSASRPTAFQEGFLDFVQTTIFQLPGLGMTVFLIIEMCLETEITAALGGCLAGIYYFLTLR